MKKHTTKQTSYIMKSPHSKITAFLATMIMLVCCNMLAAYCWGWDTDQGCPESIVINGMTCTIGVGKTNYHWIKNDPNGRESYKVEDPQCRYDCSDGSVHHKYTGAHPDANSPLCGGG